MITWVFFGRVLPERIHTTCGPINGFLKPTPLLPRGHEFTVWINDSQVIVEVSVDEADADDVFTLRNMADAHVRVLTDLIGYQEGCSLDVEIVSAVCKEKARSHVFSIYLPVLTDRRPQGARNPVIFGSILNAVATHPGVQFALAEFRKAIANRDGGSGFHCFCAIEAMAQQLRQSEGDEGEKDAVMWDRFRTRLRIDRTAIDEVKRHSDYFRHGRPWFITDSEKTPVFQLTDEMIKRYLEYLVHNSVALEEDRYPVLKHETAQPKN